MFPTDEVLMSGSDTLQQWDPCPKRKVGLQETSHKGWSPAPSLKHHPYILNHLFDHQTSPNFSTSQEQADLQTYCSSV